MPKIVNFNNRQVIEPGSYSKIESGVVIPPVSGTSGVVVVIDTGIGAGYGYGSGINGSLASGSESIYSFENASDAKRAIRGGLLWELMDFLWTPSINSQGPERMIYARAATTVAATIPFTFAAGAMNLSPKTEGPTANGVLNTNGFVVGGYSVRMKAGVVDPAKFYFEFYEGRYRGTEAVTGREYDAPANELNNNNIVAQSIEVSNVAELLAWMLTDYEFNLYFKVNTSTSSTTTFVSSDLTTYGAHNLATGGTIVYGGTAIDDVLAAMDDLDNSMFLCLDHGPTPTLTSQQIADGANRGAKSANNTKILSYCVNTSTITEKALYIGGGSNANEFTRPSTSDGSLQIASSYNHALAILVHSGIKVENPVSASGNRFLQMPSLYHAALVCGRVSGLPPQTPVTYKDIRIAGLTHELKKAQREQALKAGVLHTRYVDGMGFVINQGINTLLSNSSLITQQGTSPEIQIMRIIHQINKELVMNATPRFVGGNLNTSSAEDVKAFVEGYLTSITATRLIDNLIISFSTVTVTLDQSSWNVRYCFVPNSAVNRLFFTGVILDPNISI